MRDILYMLGDYFIFVIIACVEIVVGVFFIIHYFSRRKLEKSRKRISEVKGIEKILIDEVSIRDGEVFLIVRKKDKMPLYIAGNIENMLGVTRDMLKKDITCLLSRSVNKENTAKIWNQYIKWDEKEPYNAEFLRDNGEWIRLSVSKGHKDYYHMFYMWKTTEYHKMLDMYVEKTRQAEEESNFKTSFLSRMSHEIRTPMNGIIGMLTLAKGKVLPDAPVNQYLDRADELSQHMLSLINDILDMSRIEAGKVELENQPFSIKKLGNKLYDMFAKNLEARGIDYSINYENMTVDCVVGDELRISQVIINFLSNAVKFTNSGQISVTFRQMMLDEDGADIMIRVHDTGIGMESDFIKRIFRPFEQESIDTSKKYGGTGLGMAISDSLIKLMGGEIVVESVKGEGSDFFVYLHLPIAKADEVIEQEEVVIKDTVSDNVFQGKRILMAEDNEINAMIATEIIQNMGAKIDVVGDGQQAVDMFSQHVTGYFDFILMDVQMPVMDGRTATKMIRALDRMDAKQIPIFALSADAFVEDERQSIECGMNAHFAKPLNFNVLQKEIAKYL